MNLMRTWRLSMSTNLKNKQNPNGWFICNLPDFTEIVMGQSPASDTYNKNGDGLPFFQGKAEFGFMYPSVLKFCNAPKKIAKKGAILLSVRAPVGPTNLAIKKCCIGRGLSAIHSLGEIEPKFIFYLFRAIEPDISKEGTGSTFTAINKQFLHQLQVSLPPLKEQHRIVKKIEQLFSELDQGIKSLKTARDKLKIYRQSLLKQAFEGKLTENWRLENVDKLETAEELLKRIKTERELRYQQQVDDWKKKVKAWENQGKDGKKPAKPRKIKELSPISEVELRELPYGWFWEKLGWMTCAVGYGTSAKSSPKGIMPVLTLRTRESRRRW